MSSDALSAARGFRHEARAADRAKSPRVGVARGASGAATAAGLPDEAAAEAVRVWAFLPTARRALPCLRAVSLREIYDWRPGGCWGKFASTPPLGATHLVGTGLAAGLRSVGCRGCCRRRFRKT